MISALVPLPGWRTVIRGVRRLVSDQMTVSLVVGKSRSAPQYLQMPCTMGPFGLGSFQ
jgi:hypothetical protein